jgi:hypothetical protein
VEPLTVVIALFVIAAVLPVLGFGRLLWRSQGALNAAMAKVQERGHDKKIIKDFNEENESVLAGPKVARNSVVWDICLVGTGLAAGAVASIWSLFPTW